jgi:hypothetical protein
MTTPLSHEFARSLAGAKPRATHRGRSRRLPIGIGLLLAAALSIGLWALAIYALRALID